MPSLTIDYKNEAMNLISARDAINQQLKVLTSTVIANIADEYWINFIATNYIPVFSFISTVEEGSNLIVATDSKDDCDFYWCTTVLSSFLKDKDSDFFLEIKDSIDFNGEDFELIIETSDPYLQAELITADQNIEYFSFDVEYNVNPDYVFLSKKFIKIITNNYDVIINKIIEEQLYIIAYSFDSFVKAHVKKHPEWFREEDLSKKENKQVGKAFYKYMTEDK